jgi:hypothetical protein
MSRARTGTCAICGCTYYSPCPEGCGWANADQTLCDNPVCIRTAEREQRLLRAINAVLAETHNSAHSKAMKSLAKASEKVPVIDLRKAQWRVTGGAA